MKKTESHQESISKKLTEKDVEEEKKNFCILQNLPQNIYLQCLFRVKHITMNILTNKYGFWLPLVIDKSLEMRTHTVLKDKLHVTNVKQQLPHR